MSLGSVSSTNNQNNTRFSAKPLEVAEQVISTKKAVKKAVSDTLDNAVEVVAEAAAVPVEKTLINSIAPVRRLVSLPDMFQNGETLAALSMAGLTAVSLPEDCRDIRDAFTSSKAFFSGRRVATAYNHRKYQHDFSFFRGTLLHEWMKTAKTDKMKNFVSKIYSLDKTLYNTWFGRGVQKLLGIKNGRSVASKVKKLDGSPLYVQASVVDGRFKGFKELTARAMKRTSVLGLVFLAFIETPKLIKSIIRQDDTSDKVKEGAKQLGRAALNILGISAGMGYGGAWGAKKFGAVGSLVGMGAGLLLGCGITDTIKRFLLPSVKPVPKPNIIEVPATADDVDMENVDLELEPEIIESVDTKEAA